MRETQNPKIWVLAQSPIMGRSLVILLLALLGSFHFVLGYDSLMVVGGYYYDSDVGVNKYLR